MKRSKQGNVDRRQFLSTLAAATATLPAISALATYHPARKASKKAAVATRGSRAERVYVARMKAAEAVRSQPLPQQVANGDESRYGPKWGNYTKGLPHAPNGEVHPDAYRAYIDAVRSEDSGAFERIPLGGYLKLANPQAAYAIELVGPDAESLTLPPAPALASPEQAGELAEMYWHALLRDVSFATYDSDETVARACRELSRMSDFRGPKENGHVTPATLFRGGSAGGRRGPYISQFLLRDIPLSPIRVPQKIRTAVAGRDYLTAFDDWLAIQNGGLFGVNTFDESPRHVRNGRDLGEYVHRDFTYQTGLCACMMLLKMSAPLDGGIPYQYSITQGGFVTFGPSDIFHIVATVANTALKATWYQKWIVHRRSRPEELAGHLHQMLSGQGRAPFHRDIAEAEVVQLIHQRTGSYLLPQAYPEGAPSHPSYPAGHAVIAGACVTVLKACFAESWVMPQCVVPSRDGNTLEPYHGPELTVGGELDKLAENIAFGRNFAGIHWRTDGTEGIRLGEEFAIRWLREAKLTASEFFHGFGLTKFDGTQVTI